MCIRSRIRQSVRTKRSLPKSARPEHNSRVHSTEMRTAETAGECRECNVLTSTDVSHIQEQASTILLRPACLPNYPARPRNMSHTYACAAHENAARCVQLSSSYCNGPCFSPKKTRSNLPNPLLAKGRVFRRKRLGRIYLQDAQATLAAGLSSALVCVCCVVSLRVPRACVYMLSRTLEVRTSHSESMVV